MLKYIYIILGMITLILGLIGIVTPGLPTTPFLLLTAFLFAKSSPRLHKWLLNHKITGHYIKRVNKGLSLRGRLISISIMWCMVCFSAFVIFSGNMRYVMIGLGIVGTIAQLIILRKRKPAQQPAIEDISKTSESEKTLRKECKKEPVEVLD